MEYPYDERGVERDPRTGQAVAADREETVYQPVSEAYGGEGRILAADRAVGPVEGRVGDRAALPVMASWPSALALLGGVWLVVSRLAIDFPAGGVDDRGYWNGIVIGAAVALVATARMASPHSNPALSLVNAVLGGWMIASLWVYDYADWTSASRPTWSDLITGAVIAVAGLASWSAGVATRPRRPRPRRARRLAG